MELYQVYNEKTNEILFKGDTWECQKYINDNISRFEFEGLLNDIWIEPIRVK